MALNGKKDRARELKQHQEQPQQKQDEETITDSDEKEDEYLSSFLKLSGAIKVGE